MPSFDPSVISDIGGSGPDIAGSMAKAFQLKDLMDHEQLNQLSLTSKKQQVADEQTRKQILSGSDVSTQKGMTEASEKLTRAGQPDAAMDLRRYAQSITSGELEQKVNQLKLHDAAQDLIANHLDSLWAQATAMKEKTPDGRPKYTDAAVNAMIQGQVTATVSGIQSDSSIPDDVKGIALKGVNQTLAQNGGAITYDQLTAFEQASNHGQKQIKGWLDQMNIHSEIDHRKVEESQGQQRIGLSKQNAGSFGGDNGDLLAALAEKGVSLPAGFRSKSQQVALLDGLRSRNPGKSPDEIAQLVADGQISFGAEKKETTTAAGIAGRVSVGENELIDFAPKALAISAKVPRGDFVPFNKLKQLGERNISDPDLKELYGRTNAILNAYDVVASRGGTDKDKRAENRKNLETADSPQAYKRAVETMMDEARIAKGAARKAEGRSSDTGNQPPPQALKSLAEGVHTTFGNGQTWTLQDGKPVQVGQ